MTAFQRRLWNLAVDHAVHDRALPVDLEAALVEQGLDPSAIGADTEKE